MSELIVEARGLHASYHAPAGGRQQVLRGVDLALRRGELVALLGPNGSGKTTLLRCVAGTLLPDGGEISLFGRALPSWSRMALARRVAVLPQALELPEGFRVGELVEMGRLPHASRRFAASVEDTDAIARALADADALELVDRHPHDLSGGERQRVLIAMALAQEPDLLLLDEPTLHLDVAHQAALLATIERLRARRGLTVLAVLHDLNLARAHAPRVIVLADGRAVAGGPPDEVLRPDLVRDLYGVAVEEAITAEGRRFLVPRAASTRANEPFHAPEGIHR
ncbi:MAG: ABC transporter ATP-binding protein [Candidatus Limnocylindria bacterium]